MYTIEKVLYVLITDIVMSAAVLISVADMKHNCHELPLKRLHPSL